MSIGPRTKPRQEPACVVTLESMDYAEAKVSGVFSVTLPDTRWRSRPASGIWRRRSKWRSERCFRGTSSELAASLLLDRGATVEPPWCSRTMGK